MEAFVGTIMPCLFNYAPTGWLLCDGSAYSIADYNVLYSLIGTTFGGNASEFNVPDLRGRVAIGAGTYNVPNDNSATYVLGQTGGSTTPSIAPHTHAAAASGGAYTFQAGNMTATTNPATQPAPGSGFIPAAANAVDNSGGGAAVPDIYAYGPASNQVAMSAIQITGVTGLTATVLPNSGNIGQTANMQPSAVVNYMICANGIYPQRP